jgi:cytochrome c-type biogenesis protein CcmH/NrfF
MICFLSLWAWMFYIVLLLVGTSWMRKERKKEKVSKERKKEKDRQFFGM